jgi:MOSC domain-containing protein YiiM
MNGYIHALNRSDGGVPKLAVGRAEITRSGLVGDRQENLKHHGGPDRALCLYCLEAIEKLQAEGHPIAPGSTGENLTLAGLDWNALTPGVFLELGPEVVIEIASYTVPCKTIRGSFREGGFTRISQKLHPGWSRLYARVLREGWVSVGDAVRILPGAPPEAAGRRDERKVSPAATTSER